MGKGRALRSGKEGKGQKIVSTTLQKKHIHTIQEQVKASYAAIAGEFDRTRQKPWEEFHHFLGYVKKESRVLDLGCGNGRLAELLATKEVDYLGVDNNSVLLAHAQKNFPAHRFLLQDMTALDLPEKAFDLVFCIAAFHHLPDKKSRAEVAESIHHVLKEDGILILTVWNLFQWRYAGALLRAVGSWLLHFTFKYAWNDLWIKWSNFPLKRYYHAFLPKELLSYFEGEKWKIEEFYFTRKGERASFLRSFNLVLVARKLA